MLCLLVGGIAVFMKYFGVREAPINRPARDGSNTLERRTEDSQGRLIAFQTPSANFGVLDTNDRIDIYVQDRHWGDFLLVSTDSSGNQGNGDSTDPSISADGRYVAFRSASTNFFPGDSNESDDVFVKDLKTGAITCASTNADGQLANDASSEPAISADSRYVTFRSLATNLAPADIHPHHDTFTKDLITQATTRACVPRGLPALARGRPAQQSSGTRANP
jgi:hypothetical protein